MWLSGSRLRKRSGKKRLAPFPILQDLAFDGDDVRQHVPVRDDDALGIGRRTRREDDLGHIVSADTNRGRLAVVPLDLPQVPDGRVEIGLERWDILTGEDDSCGDNAAHARKELGRRAVVYGDNDDSAEEASPERDDPFGTVLAPEDDLVAFADASLVQPRRKAARGAADLCVRVPPASEPIVVDEKLAAGAGEIVEKIDERLASHE